MNDINGLTNEELLEAYKEVEDFLKFLEKDREQKEKENNND